MRNQMYCRNDKISKLDIKVPKCLFSLKQTKPRLIFTACGFKSIFNNVRLLTLKSSKACALPLRINTVTIKYLSICNNAWFYEYNWMKKGINIINVIKFNKYTQSNDFELLFCQFINTCDSLFWSRSLKMSVF